MAMTGRERHWIFAACCVATVLRTTSRKVVFILCVVPMAMFKNAVRIVTLSLLARHVDKGWLTGSDLHRSGGIIFCLLTLAMMAPILWAMRRTERIETPKVSTLDPSRITDYL